MKILPISQSKFIQINKNYTFGNNGISSNIQFEKEDNIETTNQLNSAIMYAMVSLPILLGLLYLGFSKKGKNFFSNPYKFESLKNDSKIPILDECKSINKSLKTYLQQQVNYVKADSSIINDAGDPQMTNKLLLTGPPGNGKTFFSKIFAKTIDAEYLEVRQSDFNSKWAGEGTANFKNIFESILKEAQKNKDKKYVVCFNEIDTIVQPAESLTGSQSSHGTTLLQHRAVFLTYMEDLKDKAPNVIVIGTTNLSPKYSKLDKASISRFKKVIEVPFPEKECIYEAIKMNLKNIKGSEAFIKDNDIKLQKFSEELEKRKFSFRNIEAVVEDAKNEYISEALEKKSKEFKFEYLEKAKNNFSITDGEHKI